MKALATNLPKESKTPPDKGACACGKGTGKTGTCQSCQSTPNLWLQPKLKIGASHDQYENEADRIADQVMRMSSSFADSSPIMPSGFPKHPRPRIQRRILGEPTRDTGSDTISEQTLNTPAQGLPFNTRAFMEPRFGRNFSNIRIHQDSHSQTLNQSLNARAFTYGQHIYFGSGEYQPHSYTGRSLLAHELVHSVQQSHTPDRVLQRQSTGSAPTSAPGLTPLMLEQIARRLHDAMSGLGTDEEAIYAALSGRSQSQHDDIAQTYETMYGTELQADLVDELTGSELRRLALQAPENVSEAQRSEMIAILLRDAMQGLGTDESAIFSALTGRTAAERGAIVTAYQTLTTRKLFDDLHDELSGTELMEAVRLFNQGVLLPEDELYLAMRGLGTDEERITRILNSVDSNPAAIQSMESAYRTKYGDLIADLRSDLSGNEYEPASGTLGPVLQDAAFEDCPPQKITTIRSALPLVGQNINRAISVLRTNWGTMNVAQKTVFNQYFDPGATGGVDQSFIDDVLHNFRLLKQEYDGGMTFECEDGTGQCNVQNRYGWTVFGNIHICPYFFNMTPSSQSWGLLHELTHNALHAVDRHYGHEPGFQNLTPRGTVANQIPVIGPLVRVIVRDDTLYNPDSYALFAFNV